MLAPGARSKFETPKFEPEVFRKQMYCIEERTSDIVGTFGALVIQRIVIQRPGDCGLLPLVTPLPYCKMWKKSELQQNNFIVSFKPNVFSRKYA